MTHVRRTVRPFVLCLLLTGALLAVDASPAAAQLVFESVGERALGMAGAFVAVADDATATHWNPAGLASGQPIGATVGWNRFQFGDPRADPVAGAARRSGTFTSLGTWPLGMSYATIRDTRIVSADGGPAVAETLQVRQVGATVLQSVLPGLVVGSTLKFLRGGVAVGPASGATAGDVLDDAAGFSADAGTRFDLDLGVMASSDVIRIGLTWKNLRAPSFGEIPGTERRLPRQARLGVAVLPVDGVTLAMDFDLDTVDLAGGLRRMGAIGGEIQLGPALGIRSGVRWSLVGPRHPVGAVGLSVAIRPRLWVDGHYAKGQQDEDREFGVAMRAGF